MACCGAAGWDFTCPPARATADVALGDLAAEPERGDPGGTARIVRAHFSAGSRVAGQDRDDLPTSTALVSGSVTPSCSGGSGTWEIFDAEPVDNRGIAGELRQNRHQHTRVRLSRLDRRTAGSCVGG